VRDDRQTLRQADHVVFHPVAIIHRRPQEGLSTPSAVPVTLAARRQASGRALRVASISGMGIKASLCVVSKHRPYQTAEVSYDGRLRVKAHPYPVNVSERSTDTPSL
jgi:hypothetical protein